MAHCGVIRPLHTRQFVFFFLFLCGLVGVAAQTLRHSPSQPHPTSPEAGGWAPEKLGVPLARDPIFVYNNWSAYDELSDNVPLTEQLAMKELDEILRLRKFGVRFDYYIMDAFWFAPDGGYRTWRKPNWPSGPDQWIKKCRENGILPGLWFGTNQLVKINAIPAWEDSLDAKKGEMSFSEGGFLPNFMETLQYWYDRGIRIFKFDFADFDAATPEAEKTKTKEEIRRRNVDAFREALKKFREHNPDIVLVAYNGFGGDIGSTAGPFPFHDPIDLRWLEVFDSLYSGDPKPSDVPEMNFWRSMDIYSDHMVRRYAQSFVPLERIDSSAFMLGNTGTIMYRGNHAWKGALILMMARGGWVNTVYGNLELLSADDARWFAKVQSLYLHLQSMGRTKPFGGIPGEVQPYGFGSLDADGAVYAVVNPAQSVEEISLPRLSKEQVRQKHLSAERLLFSDAGFQPVLRGNSIQLGPGQMALVGYGKYASADYDFGIQADVVVPRSIKPFAATFAPSGKNTIQAIVTAPLHSDLRIVMQQHSLNDGSIMRSRRGAPPDGTKMGKFFVLSATQDGKPIPVQINYDKAIWSGLSWAVGEITQGNLRPGQPVSIQCSSGEQDPVRLTGAVYEVKY
jgi:hypothetical protein